jgi:hypothetical protein
MDADIRSAVCYSHTIIYQSIHTQKTRAHTHPSQGRLAVEIAYLSLDTEPYRASTETTLPPLTEEDEDDDQDDTTNPAPAPSPSPSPSVSTAAAASSSPPPIRVPLLTYLGREEDGQRIGAHFRRVADLFVAVFDQPLALDLGPCEKWDPGALAKLLLAAFPSAFGEGEGELEGLFRCLDSGELVPYEWMRARFLELPPVVRMLRLVDKLQREKAAGR